MSKRVAPGILDKPILLRCTNNDYGMSFTWSLPLLWGCKEMSSLKAFIWMPIKKPLETPPCCMGQPEIGAKQGGTPERRTANRPSANLVNQQQPKRTSTQKLQGRGGWARFVKGLGAVQTRGDAGKAYRQPTFGEPCKPTTTKTNLDAEIARPGGLGEVCQRPGRCSTFVLSPSVKP